MNAMLRNEFRMVRSAWLTALIVGAGFRIVASFDAMSQAPDFWLLVANAALILTASLISLAVFGSEFNLGTFSALLSQPRARDEIWRTKMFVLLVATGSVAIVAYLFGFHDFHFGHLGLALAWDWKNYMAVLLPVLCVVCMTGLWTTLAYRRASEAFWTTLCAPFGLYLVFNAILEHWLGQLSVGFGSSSLVWQMMGLVYTPIAYFLARFMFMRAEAVQLFSSDTALSANPSFSIPLLPSLRKPRWAVVTLIVNEIRLYQNILLVAFVFALLHVASIFLPVFGPKLSLDLRKGLELVGFLWFLVPFLIACASISEERRIGTLSGTLTLPIRRIWIFATKVFVVFALAIFFGLVVPKGIECLRFGYSVPPFGAVDTNDLSAVLRGSAVFIAVFIYASSLTGSVLHAVSACIFIGCLSIGGMMQSPANRIAYFLPSIVLWLALSYWNFKQPRITTREVGLNFLWIIAYIAFARCVCGYIYGFDYLLRFG